MLAGVEAKEILPYAAKQQNSKASKDGASWSVVQWNSSINYYKIIARQEKPGTPVTHRVLESGCVIADRKGSQI